MFIGFTRKVCRTKSNNDVTPKQCLIYWAVELKRKKKSAKGHINGTQT